MTLPRLFYKLSELAKKWKKTENDLLQLAATGNLELSTKHYGTAFIDGLEEVEIRDYVQLKLFDCKMILEWGIGKGHTTMSAKWKGERVLADVLAKVKGLPVHPFLVSNLTDLIVLPDEVTRVEGNYPELANHQQTLIPRTDDEEYVEGNKAIELESGLSFNTFKKYADLAEIEIGKAEGRNPKNRIKKVDIRGVLKHKKEY